MARRFDLTHARLPQNAQLAAALRLGVLADKMPEQKARSLPVMNENRPDAAAGIPPPEGLSANGRPSCRGPILFNPYSPLLCRLLLCRLSPASSLL